MQIRKRASAVIGGIIAVVAVTTAGAAGAGTHWFGLGYPHYRQQIISGCNADWRTARADLAAGRAALRNLEPGVAQQLAAEARAALDEMKAQGCPEGPYPLRNHD